MKANPLRYPRPVGLGNVQRKRLYQWSTLVSLHKCVSVKGVNLNALCCFYWEIVFILLVLVTHILHQHHPGPPWANKTEQAFFRGRDSREERLHLVALSKRNPELLDAGITAWFFYRDQEKHFGKTALVGFFDFFKVRAKVLLLLSFLFELYQFYQSISSINENN